jgi:uncharacterized RDD family membrane protein YckC
MSHVDWSQYRIDLSPQPARKSTAPRPQPVSPPLARRSARLVAHVLDVCIALFPIVVAFVWMPASHGSPEMTKLRQSIWVSTMLAVVVVQMTLLSLRGQTLGKMALGLRIVDYEDESNPGFLHAVVLRHIVPFLITFVPLFGALFVFADVLFIFGDERRCLHDLIAGTKVVEN